MKGDFDSGRARARSASKTKKSQREEKDAQTPVIKGQGRALVAKRTRGSPTRVRSDLHSDTDYQAMKDERPQRDEDERCRQEEDERLRREAVKRWEQEQEEDERLCREEDERQQEALKRWIHQQEEDEQHRKDVEKWVQLRGGQDEDEADRSLNHPPQLTKSDRSRRRAEWQQKLFLLRSSIENKKTELQKLEDLEEQISFCLFMDGGSSDDDDDARSSYSGDSNHSTYW